MSHVSFRSSLHIAVQPGEQFVKSNSRTLTPDLEVNLGFLAGEVLGDNSHSRIFDQIPASVWPCV